MKNFVFVEKNGSGVLTISAIDYDDAEEILKNTVKYPNNWKVEDEDGDSF